MSDTITYRELHAQACVRREVHGEIDHLVAAICHQRGMESEKKLELICAAVKDRFALSMDLVRLSHILHTRTSEETP